MSECTHDCSSCGSSCAYFFSETRPARYEAKLLSARIRASPHPRNTGNITDSSAHVAAKVYIELVRLRLLLFFTYAHSPNLNDLLYFQIILQSRVLQIKYELYYNKPDW